MSNDFHMERNVSPTAKSIGKCWCPIGKDHTKVERVRLGYSKRANTQPLRELANHGTNTDTTAWATDFIEGWVRIETKDAPVVRQAKLEARKDFVQALTARLKEVELEARSDENSTIHRWVQKPKDYDSLSTHQQNVWVIMTLGKIGSYLDARQAELQAHHNKGEKS